MVDPTKHTQSDEHLLSQVAAEQTALREEVRHLTYLMSKLLAAVEDGKATTIEGGSQVREWFLYYKCSRTDALQQLARIFSLAAGIDGPLFTQLRAQATTVEAVVYPTSLIHGWQALRVSFSSEDVLVRLRTALRRALDKIASPDLASRIADTPLGPEEKSMRQKQTVLETAFKNLAAEALKAATQPKLPGARVRVMP